MAIASECRDCKKCNKSRCQIIPPSIQNNKFSIGQKKKLSAMQVVLSTTPLPLISKHSSPFVVPNANRNGQKKCLTSKPLIDLLARVIWNQSKCGLVTKLSGVGFQGYSLLLDYKVKLPLTAVLSDNIDFLISCAVFTANCR